MPKEQWVPHPYQERAIKLILQQSAAGLLLDPGLGKTSCTLAAFKILKAAKKIQTMLVIAPIKPMYDAWPGELKKWENFKSLKYTILHGKDKLKNVEADADVYLINPEGLKILFDENQRIKHILKRGPCMLVVDESTKFKDSTSQRFKMLKKFHHMFHRRMILTGTVQPNTAEDLFGQVYILDGGSALGRYITHFRSKYFYMPNPLYERYRWELAPGAFEKIAEKMSPLVLQLNAEDHLKMPELITAPDPRAIRRVYMPEKAWGLYRAVENEFIAEMGDNFIIAPNAAVAGGKCRQIANGALYINEEHEYAEIHDEKIEALKDLVEELQGAHLLLLYEFIHDKDRILKHFPDTPYIGSGVSQKKVSQYIEDFNAGRIKMLMGHPASMGHGLNLQGACRHVCWFGIPWNFEHYDQAVRRVYRQGQKGRTVFVYHIVATGTLDEKVLGVLGQKERNLRDLAKALVAPV